MNAFFTKTALTVAALLSTMAVAHADDWKLGVKISAADGGGVYVHEVFAGSPAELAGLSAGVTILTADGVLYNDPLDFRNVVMTGNAPSMDLIYLDGGKFYQVQAQY
jgi:S1-C subfamily serine protease